MTKAEIQLIRSLKDKRTRDDEGLFIAEGVKLVEEIRASEFSIRRIYTTRHDLTGADVEHVEHKDMERISELKSASDTLAVVEKPKYKLSLSSIKENLVIALDGIQNPGNMKAVYIWKVICQTTDCICKTHKKSYWKNVYNRKRMMKIVCSRRKKQSI